MAAPVGYAGYLEIDVQNANIDGDLTDAILLVPVVDDSDIGGNVVDTADGHDIRFYDVDTDTILYYDRVYFDVTAGDCNATFYVKCPFLYTAPGGNENKIRMYVGKAADPDGEDKPNTWSDYICVLHFADAAGTITDATGVHDSNAESINAYRQAGKIRYACDFDGTNNFVEISDHADFTTSAETIQFWANVDVWTAGRYFVFKFESSPSNEGYNMLQATTYVDYNVFVSGVGPADARCANNSSSEDTWFMIHGTRTIGGLIEIYLDGSVQVNTGNLAGEINTATNLYLMSHGYGSRTDGLMEEFRMRADDLSPDQIKFEHANMNEGDNELTWGAWTPGVSFQLLAGDIDAAATLSATLSVLREIQGEIAAAGILSADMKAARKLAGEITAAGTLSGNLKAIRKLSGEIAANATLSGDITTAALVLLAGEISSTATLSGTLKAGRGLAGEILSAGILTGTLKPTRKLAGDISAQATLSADITIAGAILLAGTIAATGTLSGTAKVLRGLSGEIDAQAVFTALLTLGVDVLLQGTISATGLLTGNLSALRKMSGDIAASGDFESVLSATKSISGLIDANAVLAGDMKPFRGLAGEISGQSALSAVLQIFRGLAGEIASTGTMSADLKAFRGLGGEIISAATLEALLRKTAGLSGEIDAQATFTGILNLLGVAITTIVMEGWLEKYPGIEAVFDKTLLWKAFLERYGATEGQLKDD